MSDKIRIRTTEIKIREKDNKKIKIRKTNKTNKKTSH